MKSLFLFMLFALAALTSCQKFLDEAPDNRTLIDSEDKVAKLLIYAYPDAQYCAFAESMSDNADDKGVSSPDVSSVFGQINKDAYLWKDYSSLTNDDTPSNFWMKSYKAIAQANQALESLEKLGSKTSRAASLRGEALLARAYAHFMLANLFSMRYDPATASTTPGIPYVLSPEENAIAQYHRETMAETYRLLEKDLTEGLPLIGDDYEKQKFHFSPQSANAFAARFYLYKGEWDKVVECASLALGNVLPALAIRDLVSASYKNASYSEKAAQYFSSTERANLLIGWTISAVARNFGKYRYGLSASKRAELFARGAGNPFQKDWAYSMYGATALYYNLPKYLEYFRVTDVTSGTGEPSVSFIHFTTDEALLNRAEAYAMLNRWEDASRDLTAFLSMKISYFSVADNQVTLALMKEKYPNAEKEYAPHYALSSDQASFVKGIAECRRREFLHEGLRWLDVKRFNLEVVHKQVNGTTVELPKNDPRRAIQIPETAKAFGIEINKR